MTQSLPGHAVSAGPAPTRDDDSPGSGERPAGREAVVNAAAGVTLRALPRIPDPVKRVLLAGRSVTIDGNTLDTTLQLMLTAQRMAGINGLVASVDVEAARAQLRMLSAQIVDRTSAVGRHRPADRGPGRPDPGPATTGRTTPGRRCWSSTTAAAS